MSTDIIVSHDSFQSCCCGRLIGIGLDYSTISLQASTSRLNLGSAAYPFRVRGHGCYL